MRITSLTGLALGAVLAASACRDGLAPELRDDDAAILLLADATLRVGYGNELLLFDYTRTTASVLIGAVSDIKLGPFWPSPDGSVLMYARGTFGGSRDSIQRLVLRGPHGTFTPRGLPAAWSPDGTRIVWTSLSDAGGEMIATDADGGSPDILALGYDPVWTADSRRVLFTYAPTNTDDEIGVFDPAGARTRVNLTNNPATDIRPRPSPDGQWIAFVSGRAPGAGIYLMRADGTQPRRVYAGDNLPAPQWSADSRYLAVPRQHPTPPDLSDQIIVVDLVGAVHATISFPLNGLGSFRWAPNRNVLLVVAAPAYGGVSQAFVVSDDGREQEQITHAPNGIAMAMWIRR